MDAIDTAEVETCLGSKSYRMPIVDRLGMHVEQRFGVIERKSHGTVTRVCGYMTMASILDAIGVDAGCGPLRGTCQWIAIATIVIDVFQIEGMDVSGEVTGKNIAG
jgi:hypothetical protein